MSFFLETMEVMKKEGTGNPLLSIAERILYMII
jgi:hypothetical protein